MKFEVTQHLIDAGEAKECSACPVALAIKHATNSDFVEVGANYISISGKYIPTPEIVERFISHFDDGRIVEPFTFELPIEP